MEILTDIALQAAVSRSLEKIVSKGHGVFDACSERFYRNTGIRFTCEDSVSERANGRREFLHRNRQSNQLPDTPNC